MTKDCLVTMCSWLSGSYALWHSWSARQTACNVWKSRSSCVGGTCIFCRLKEKNHILRVLSYNYSLLLLNYICFLFVSAHWAPITCWLLYVSFCQAGFKVYEKLGTWILLQYQPHSFCKQFQNKSFSN